MRRCESQLCRQHCAWMRAHVSDSLDAQRVAGVVQEVKPSSKKQAPYRMKWTAADGESVETTVNVLTKVDDVMNEGMEGRGGAGWFDRRWNSWTRYISANTCNA